MNFLRSINNKEKGAVAVLLAILILAVTLAVSLGVSLIFIDELKTSGLTPRTGLALYAADAGAEYALYRMIKKNDAVSAGYPGSWLPSVDLWPASQVSFEVQWSVNDRVIRSRGKQGNINPVYRKIDISW